jgi:hypothetical protein
MVSSIGSFDFLKLSGVGGARKSETPSPAEAAQTRQEMSAARQRGDLDKIRDKGLVAWAQELQQEKLEELRKQIRDKVLEEMSADEASFGKLAGAARSEFVSRVESEIDRRVRAAVEASLGELSGAAQDDGGPQKPRFLDITV